MERACRARPLLGEGRAAVPDPAAADRAPRRSRALRGQARLALSAPVHLGAPQDACGGCSRREGSHGCSRCLRRAARSSRSAAPPPTSGSSSSAHACEAREMRGVRRRRLATSTSCRARPGIQLDALGTDRRRAAAALRARCGRSCASRAPAGGRGARRRSRRRRRTRCGSGAPSATFTTVYGGIPNRIHNVQLVAHLVDGTLIAPGATFSFNQTTGDRTAAKGFLEAPVIVNGELTTGLGGGVCQVSTTVFNAAFEAGLTITRADEPRALHQPLPAGPRRDGRLPGRRPEVRERHRHTGCCCARFVGSSSLTVDLYGTPVHRRVESTTAPLERDAQAADREDGRSDLKPVRRSSTTTASLERSTSVTRSVYLPTNGSCTTTRGTRRTAPSRSSCASGRQEAEEVGAAGSDDDADHYAVDDDDAERLSRRNSVEQPLRYADGPQARDSTQAWFVQPSATTVPSSRTIVVLEAEAGAFRADAARVHVQDVVEPHGRRDSGSTTRGRAPRCRRSRSA
mgnify:CR=1 FL=1